MQNKILSNIQSIIGNEKPHFLLAVSGGVDSMVLLELFQENNELLNFSVAQPISKADTDKTETVRFNIGTTF